jgi:hypothetical protein
MIAALLAAAAMVVAAPPAAAAALDAYRGAASWVDRYDRATLRDPWPALSEMRRRGVRTVFLETGNWRLPPWRDFADRAGDELILDEAHALGMRVVAWYLPGLVDLSLDLQRSAAALGLRTASGGGFDGFAVDIESTLIGSIPARNRAIVAYTLALRRVVGRGYPLGAIVPDVRSATIAPGLWPGFPYRALAPLYDVFLPMAYSTYRVRGAARVYQYTRANIAYLRAVTGRPVHVIGGLADGLFGGEPAAVVRAARDAGAIGASFYEYSLSLDCTWRALAGMRGARSP